MPQQRASNTYSQSNRVFFKTEKTQKSKHHHQEVSTKLEVEVPNWRFRDGQRIRAIHRTLSHECGLSIDNTISSDFPCKFVHCWVQ